MSIEYYNQGASIYIVAGGGGGGGGDGGGGGGTLVEKQLNTTRASDLGASARTMSKHGGPSSCSQLP